MKYTNAEALLVYQEWNATHEKKLKWKETDAIEMRALIGLFILAGVFHGNLEYCRELWSTENGRPIFAATMSENRFEDLVHYMRFDDKTTRSERKKDDKLAAIREIWDMLIANLQKPYVPSAYLTVDEQLYSFRGRCPFLVYIPSSKWPGLSW